MRRKNKKRKKILEILIPVLALILVAGLWYGSYRFMMEKVMSDDNNVTDWTVRGQFGDMFGMINALFSGLAFAGIIFTIYLQRQELKAQRRELKLARREFKKQSKAFNDQNDTLWLQRFETTFFNLLSYHVNSINAIKFKSNGVEHNGRLFFRHMCNSMKEKLHVLVLHINHNQFNDENSHEIEKRKQINKYFSNYFAGDYAPIHLFYTQTLDSALDFILTSELLKLPEKDRYLKILSSNISHEEREIFAVYFRLFDKNTVLRQTYEREAYFEYLTAGTSMQITIDSI
jgi:hypothetical protein